MNDNANGKKPFLERFFSTPQVVATIGMALLGQAIFSVVFQVRNNEQQAAALAANNTAIRDLRDVVYGMNTPLAQRVGKIEDRTEANTEIYRETLRRLESIDSGGTRIAQGSLAQFEAVKVNISRIEDQQRRIIEALDNLYSEISKIPPALRAKPR